MGATRYGRTCGARATPTPGVLLILSLVTLRYADEARLPGWLKILARHAIPAAAILLPAASFLSVLSPEATEPNASINLAYLGATFLALGLLVLGVGPLRNRRGESGRHK